MKSYLLKIMTMLLLLMMATSCELIGDIFEAGMAVGIIVVLLVVALVIWIIRKFKR